MRTTPTSARRKRRWLKWLLRFALVLSLGLGAALWAYERIGRTPGELLDYSALRLQGHKEMASAARPVFSVLRDWLGEPSLAERRATGFFVPLPPPLAAGTLAPSLVPVHGVAPGAKTWRVGPGGELATIAEAARLARDGDIVEVQAGSYRGDVAVWLQKQLTLRAVGGRARLYADGRAAEQKAIWVIRHGDFDVSGFDFVGARVPDRNGAGIRFEGGRLRVADCLFWGNENGILTIDSDPASELAVVSSEFGYSGAGDGLSHNIYVGRLGRFSITGSYLHHANVGHLLKSRAAVSEVTYNRITDEIGGRASYELDFPNGGDVRVLGNVVQQVRETENSVILSYGAEGLAYASNRLDVASNTLVNDHPYGGTFVHAAPGTQAVVLTNNLLVGRGGIQVPANLTEILNPRVDWRVFVRAVRQDYRLNEAGRTLVFQAAGVPVVDIPRREYRHPRQVVDLDGPPHVAGALQTKADQTPPS